MHARLPLKPPRFFDRADYLDRDFLSLNNTMIQSSKL